MNNQGLFVFQGENEPIQQQLEIKTPITVIQINKYIPI